MIAPETIAQIKERTDIVALIGESVRLQRRGRSFLGLCPFHKEKSPSFHVHPDRGFYHCFGCSESGSAIDFVMKTSGLDFVEAVKMLADRAGIPIEERRSSAAERARKTERDELFEVMQLAATFYERMLGLAADPSAARGAHALVSYPLAELSKRRLPSPRAGTEEAARFLHVAQAFRLGYAPPGWDALSTFLKQQGVSPTIGERAGLLVPGPRGHYDRFRHRLMFAVMDTLGRVVAFSGRALPAPTKEELAKHAPSGPSYDKEEAAKYINSPESPIYTKGEQLFGVHQARAGIRQRGFAILVEGNFDVFSLHARGIDNAVAPLGTAFTPEQAKLLKRFAPSVVIAFDGDAAGRKATRAARVPCRTGGLDAKVAVLPDGVDPDDLVQNKGPDALLALVGDARGMLDHLIQDALDGEGFRGASLAERVARVRAVAKLLGEEDDPNLRLMAKRYADQLSAKLVVAGSSVDDLRQLERMVEEAMSEGAARRGSPRPQHRESAASARWDPRKREIFGAILDFPDLLSDPDVQNMLQVAEDELALAIAALRQFAPAPALESGSTPAPGGMPGGGKGGFGAGSIEDFLAALPSSIQKFAAGRLAAPAFEEAGPARANLLENLKKLGNSLGQVQNSRVVDALQRSPTLDADSEELLRQEYERARKRRGID